MLTLSSYQQVRLGGHTMQYNFDEIVNRYHTNAMNTDGFRGYIFNDFEGKKKFPFKDDEFVRMWVADMEFATPDVVIDGMIGQTNVLLDTAKFLSRNFMMHITHGIRKCMIGRILKKTFAFP